MRTYSADVQFTPYGGGDKVQVVLPIMAETRQEAKDKIENLEATQDGHKYEFVAWLD